MAAFLHFPTLVSFTSHKLLLSYHHSCKTILRTHQHYNHTISASSTKRTRAKKKVTSNAELCNDIREFISVVGLPEGHVPSTKELSQHGRQDLANIVRRRGYKLIRHLLATSIESDENRLDKIECLFELHAADGKGQHESTGEEQKHEDMTDDVLLSDEVPIEHNHSKSANGDIVHTSFDSDGRSTTTLESSLQDKVTNFSKSGELEGDGFEISHVVGGDGANGLNKSEDSPKDPNSNVKEGLILGFGRSNTGKALNGSISQSKQDLLQAPENHSPRDIYFPNGGLSTADCDEVSDVEIRKRKEETDVNRLKFMIHQKELELAHLKEEIEKEKLALSLLHTKVEKEISKTQKLVSGKDTELLAAEEILSDLKEVHVQYMGDGDTVQVAGSFNGWHHQITMDPQPSIFDPIKSRYSKLWSIVLWLYPGIYEIKFVIDGNWRIDPQRETVTMGSIENNILRVDR